MSIIISDKLKETFSIDRVEDMDGTEVYLVFTSSNGDGEHINAIDASEADGLTEDEIIAKLARKVNYFDDTSYPDFQEKLQDLINSIESQG